MSDGGRNQAAQPCLFLLFSPGTRPSFCDVEAAVAAMGFGHISHAPHETGHGGSDWLELLLDGLTFDLLGLAPGPRLIVPAPHHSFGISRDQIAGREAIGLAPGPHLAGAHSAMPVVRTLLRLGAGLASQWPTATGALWHPARSAMARELFLDATNGWLSGGAFPALGLTGVVERAGGLLASDGLAFFTGQELVLDKALSIDRIAATRLLVRLIDGLVEKRSLKDAAEMVLPDGTTLRLLPAGTTISVSRI